MIDRNKRQTLKNIAAGSAVAAVSTSAVASSLLDADTSAEETVQLRVHTRVSVKTNDIEVVLTNSGTDTAYITELTPVETVTKRGRFNFATLTDNGELSLQAGQSVSVPMTPHPVVIDASDASVRSASLTDALKKSMTAHSHGKLIDLRVMDATLFS